MKKLISIILLGMFLFQSCTVYKGKSIALEDAYDKGKVKVHLVDGRKFKFKNLINEDDIKKLVSGTPGVLHYGKNNSGHSHNLINRVYWNRNENRIVNIDISNKIYHRELMSLSGHTIAEQIQNKPNKPLYNHKL